MARKKDKSPFGKLTRPSRRRKGKREFGGGLGDALSKRAGFGQKKPSRANNSRMVKQAARAWANRLTPTERWEEREQIIDELENNPKRFADEVKGNRLAAAFPWIKRIADYLTAAANRRNK